MAIQDRELSSICQEMEEAFLRGLSLGLCGVPGLLDLDLLSAALTPLTSILREEARLLGGVDEEEIQSSSNQLQIMRSYLKNFECVSKEPLIVYHIREVVYDIEDVIEKHACISQDRSRESQLWYRLGPSKLIAQRNIAVRIINIKKKLEELYKMFILGMHQGVEVAAAEGSSWRRLRRAPILKESEVVGFTDETEMLVKQLTEGTSGRAVVSIVGMGGLGKTTLAKKVYNHNCIKESFNCRAWVYVSQENTLEGVMLGILKNFTDDDNIKGMEEEDLRKVLYSQLKDKKYLIALDDVWKPQVWEDLRALFPDNMNGSRILLTTRINKVASLAGLGTESPPMHHLRFRKKEESWELLRNKAFRQKTCSQQWEEVGKQIAEKCDGLPLAIVIIGNLLSEKRGTFEEWSRVAMCISTFLSECPAEFKEILASSYNDLPHCLKPCFLYFSAFPKDDQIPAKDLIHSWIDKGFIEANSGETVEEKAEGYLETLVDRNLVLVEQMITDPGVKAYRVHCLLHEFCVSEARREGSLQANGKWIGNIKKRTQEIHGMDMQIADAVFAEGSFRRQGTRAHTVEQSNVVGFKNEIQTLVTRLTQLTEQEDYNLTVISIVGMGGLGKTTLAKKIYNDVAVKEKFEHRAWVRVSQDYDPSKLMRSILECFERVVDCRSMQSMAIKLQRKLQDAKYLIVMDDVWQPRVWHELRRFFPDNAKGSRILLTTRVTEVAQKVDSMNRPHYLRFLDKEESWELFRSKAFLGEICSKKWEKLGRQIATKCGGLPLAIVGLGSLLYEKRRACNGSSRVAEEQGIYDKWSGIASNISTFLYGQSAECKRILALSYNDLPYFLKPCFLYLSAFPEDYEIPAGQLIQLWIAEGFVKEKDEETMEDTAKTYLEILADRGLIQAVQRRSDGGVKTCSIHCLFHDFCISEARQDKFLQVGGFLKSALPTEPRQLAGDADPITHILAKPKGFSKLRSRTSGKPDEWNLFKTIWFTKLLYARISKARHDKFLHVDGFVKSALQTEPRRFAGDADTITHILAKPKNFRKLRSLLCFSPTSGKPDEWSRLFRTFRFLRVFKLSYASILPDEVEKLINLRYLGLDKNFLLQLPPSVCNLPNLQVLDARSKFIRSAPAEIWKLKKLRHAYFEGPTYLPPPSAQPSSSSQDGHDDTLMDLQTLSTISAKSCTAAVFQKLPKLRKLGIKVEGYINALSDNLMLLKQLRALKLAGDANSAPVISLPLKFPPKLTKLTLSETQLEEDPMPLLGELKTLEILKLVNNAYTGSEMVAHANGFPELKFLKIGKLVFIEKLETKVPGFAKLEHLVIHECHRLQKFSGLQHLNTLYKVDLLEPSTEFGKQMEDMQQSGRRDRFQLNVYPLQGHEHSTAQIPAQELPSTNRLSSANSRDV